MTHCQTIVVLGLRKEATYKMNLAPPSLFCISSDTLQLYWILSPPLFEILKNIKFLSAELPKTSAFFSVQIKCHTQDIKIKFDMTNL